MLEIYLRKYVRNCVGRNTMRADITSRAGLEGLETYVNQNINFHTNI